MRNAPQVEREYRSLMRDYENALAQYQETKAKQSRADVGKQLESESKGERFTLIDPAALPEEPISPNRPAILFLGFVFSLGSGNWFCVCRRCDQRYGTRCQKYSNDAGSCAACGYSVSNEYGRYT